jgi:prepilin-type N-terminal cleavage/methylation domain-containing protein/prepilin-type processing-associated H-X9-DG protein
MRVKGGWVVHRDLDGVQLLIKQSGFTLIELLVVISVITLLFGILLPALNRAREAGRSVVCLANVRRISMAGYIYALEGDGALPPFRMMRRYPTDPDDFVNKYGRVRPRWPWFFDHGIGPVIDPSPYVQNPGDTFDDSDTLIMTNDYFMCPSFRHSDFDKCDIRNGSYGYNYHYLGNSRIRDDKFENFPVYVQKIRRASETVIIADSRGARGDTGGPNISHGRHSYTLDPPKIAYSAGAVNFAWHTYPDHEQQHSPAEARHSGHANVSFLDGHTEHLKLEELGYVLDSDGFVIAGDPEGDNSLWSGSGRDEP